MKKLFAFTVMVAVAVSSLYGCAPMMPSASATLLSSDIKKGSERVVPVGDIVSESDCSSMWLFFVLTGNLQPSHERLIGKILEQSKADVLLNADLTVTTFGIPYVFMKNCAVVSGQPARLVTTKEVEK